MNAVKYLHAQGLGSRKQCRLLLKQGRILMNGMLPEEESEIDAAAVVDLRLDGRALAVIPLPHYCILLHKPAGFETSHKPRDYPSIFSLLPDHIRATEPQAVGRLDADTTGVLLITNDGLLNHRLTSPKQQVCKLYRVTLKHPASSDLCSRLLDGVLLHEEPHPLAAAEAVLENTHTLLLTLTQGKYHQVKRMVAAVGNRVVALHRLRFHCWDCQGLAEGEWRFVPHPDCGM